MLSRTLDMRVFSMSKGPFHEISEDRVSAWPAFSCVCVSVYVTQISLELTLLSGWP